MARPSSPERPIDAPPRTPALVHAIGLTVEVSLTQTPVLSVSTETHADTGVTWRKAWLGRLPWVSTTYQPLARGSGKRITPAFAYESSSTVALKAAVTGSPSVGMLGVECSVQRGAAR